MSTTNCYTLMYCESAFVHGDPIFMEYCNHEIKNPMIYQIFIDFDMLNSKPQIEEHMKQ